MESYGRTLIPPPEGGFPPDLDVYPIERAVPRRLVATMPLLTKEEGLSDLTVELTLIEVAPHNWITEIENIHVM